MCGIAGFASLDADPTAGGAALERVARMLPALARRGPDGEGLAGWPQAALGHRRLAILDLSETGKQPMLSADGQTGVAFNGCIYNFRDLRRELESLGHRFRSHCDTEVILEGYLEWGIDGLVRRLGGMFAFGVWDNRIGELHLVRDRLGVKPLVYARSERGLAFASTVDALRRAGFGGSIDSRAVLEFLEFGFVTDERSIFEGIDKLPPAHILTWKNGDVQLRCYWSLDVTPDSRISFEDAVRETERLLVDTVRERLISDVPIGVLLSGGVDSGLVCWALRELNADVRSFTVGTPGDADDETAAASETARRLGITNEVVHLPPDEGAPLDELGAAYAEPFASTSSLGMLRVSRAVKARATVLLTGDGGDDVYLGYPFFYNAWKAQRLARRLPDFAGGLWPLGDTFLRALSGIAPPVGRVRNFMSYTTGGVGAYARVRLGLPYFEQGGLLGERLRGKKLAHREVIGSLDAGRHLLDDVFQFHRRHHFLSEFMTKVDGATMHHALEARAPFLDYKVWEFAARLPYPIRFHGGQLKAVLREIARRRLGHTVSSRPKQGFTIPAERWLLTRWAADAEALAENSISSRQGWFRPNALRDALRAAKRTGETPPQLWHMVVLENWLRRRATS